MGKKQTQIEEESDHSEVDTEKPKKSKKEDVKNLKSMRKTSVSSDDKDKRKKKHKAEDSAQAKSKKKTQGSDEETEAAPRKRKSSTQIEPEPRKKSKPDIQSEFIYQVLVSNLPADFTHKSLKKIFKKCGEFDFTIPTGSNTFAIVRFKDQSSVKKALKLHQAEYKGSEILINTHDQLPSVKKRSERSATVFVGNLSNITTADQLKSFFSGCGKIKAVRISQDLEGKNKGFCHVEFSSLYAAQLATKLAGKKLNGKPLKLDLAADKRENQ